MSRFIYYYAECYQDESHYAECRYAVHRYAECHYAEYRYAECRGARTNALAYLGKKSFIRLTPYFLGARFIIVFSLKIDQDPTRECGGECKKIFDLSYKFEKLGNSLILHRFEMTKIKNGNNPNK